MKTRSIGKRGSRSVVFALLISAFTIGATSRAENGSGAENGSRAEKGQWSPLDISLQADREHPWWEFPVEATFTHIETGATLNIQAFYNGSRQYTLRFAPPLPGEWRYRTHSADSALDGQVGILKITAATSRQVEENANLHGHLKISDSKRYLEHADETPCLLLADTNWSINTARCGLGTDRDGPFYQYLADRKAKGFTAILISYMRGFGDTKDPAGQRNERGYPFDNGDTAALNAEFFQALDIRMHAIWDDGFIIAAHPTWFGKLNCFFDFKSAQRISAYLAVRYGAFTSLWSLSGEYQYAMKDCGWTMAQISELGDVVQGHNPYRRLVSIHPSGRTNWQAPHGAQSSRAFHDSSWLDINWLQTGQKSPLMFNVAKRSLENRRLSPPKPFFLSEGYYEHADDPEHRYHSRWQIWTALLNGAAGYGYGAWGLWQFYDPHDAQGETGKTAGAYRPWQESMALEGSQQIQPVRQLLQSLPWWQLHPDREALAVDGEANPMPTPEDLSPPHRAQGPDGTTVIYIPRGNAGKKISWKDGPETWANGFWYHPQTGGRVPIAGSSIEPGSGHLPDRPHPATEDWVFVINNSH